MRGTPDTQNLEVFVAQGAIGSKKQLCLGQSAEATFSPSTKRHLLRGKCVPKFLFDGAPRLKSTLGCQKCDNFMTL
jgi:hypothetical protein